VTEVCFYHPSCCDDTEGEPGWDSTCVSEAVELCELDCPICGDGSCDTGEDENNCPDDCTDCGNGICGPIEQQAEGACPADCCGNNICNFPSENDSAVHRALRMRGGARVRRPALMHPTAVTATAAVGSGDYFAPVR
jgi:hypothetical protein